MYRNVRTYAATCRTKHENVERTVTSGSYVRARGAVSLQQSTVYRSVMYTACAFVSYSSPSVSFSKPILIHEFQLRAQWIAAPSPPLTHVADMQCREYMFHLLLTTFNPKDTRFHLISKEREGRKTICASFTFQRILPREGSLSRRIESWMEEKWRKEKERRRMDFPLPSFRYSQLFCRSDKGGARSK